MPVLSSNALWWDFMLYNFAQSALMFETDT